MKNPILCVAACLMLLSACQKKAEVILEKVPADKVTVNTPSDFTKYTIVKGDHHASNTTYQPIETSELKFMVKFDSTAIYESISKENQFDINKLYGFSDNNAFHHTYSARIGWSWTAGALRLYGYAYNEGIRSNKELIAIPIGKEILCSIKVTSNAYLFYIDNKLEGELVRKATTVKAIGYKLYPYFGGDEAAPHNVDIWIKNL